MTDHFVPTQYSPPASALPSQLKPQAPIEIGLAHQLFLDDHLIAQKSSLHRRLNQPIKQRTPHLVADQMWEGKGVLFGCIVQVQDTWRLYYRASNGSAVSAADFQKQHGYGKNLLGMAQSADGIHFEKLPLPNAAVPGTNIVMDANMDDFCIIHDPHDPDPQQRFKMLASIDHWFDGLSVATSPDGIQWTWRQKFAVTKMGDRMSYWWDPVNQKHVAWSRNYAIHGQRSLVQVRSDQFLDWSDKVVSHPRLIVQAGSPDHPETEIYGGYGFHYHSLYIAYLEIYYKHNQRVDTQLACSRDGIHWKRLCENQQFHHIDAGGHVINTWKQVQSHDVFLPNGNHGEFDAYWVVPTFNPPILKQGKLHIHYEGRSSPHAAYGFKHVSGVMSGAMALATLREDGFVSLDATGLVGSLTTHVLKLPDKPAGIDINACPFITEPGYDPMEVGVDVLDAATQQVVDAFEYIGMPDADTTWLKLTATKPWPPLVQLQFRLRNARLYSFRMRT